MAGGSAARCPECEGALALVDDESTPNIAVSRCSSCSTGFIRRGDEELRPYRRGPFVGVLYALIFERDPAARAPELAERFVDGSDPEEVEFMARCCEAELRSPSLDLATVHDFAHRPGDAALRQFLRRFAEGLRRGSLRHGDFSR